MSALILPPGKPALLVIDLQNDFLHPDGKFASGLPGRSLPEIAQEKNLTGIANKVITAARAATVPIIYVKHAYRPDYADLPRNVRVFASMRERQGLQDGSWGADFLDAVKPAPPDFVVTKTRVSSFYATSLAGILRALGTTCLIVMGVVTNGAVEGTVRDAADRGYDIVLVEDGCIASTEEAHRAAAGGLMALLTTVVKSDEVVQALAEQ